MLIKPYLEKALTQSRVILLNWARQVEKTTLAHELVRDKNYTYLTFGELKKQATWNKTITQLYHCRTTAGQEVDIILEDRSGNIVGIEIKSNEKVSVDDFKGLKYLHDKMKERFIAGIVLNTGSQPIPFAHNLHALPINVLWNGIWSQN